MKDGLIETAQQDRVLIVGAEIGPEQNIDESLEELERLVETAGGMVLGRIVQRREKPDPSYFIGKGKLEELKALKEETQPSLVVFDDELSPAQGRNLETALEVKVLDRTALILDIFAQRARSHEGQLQVELAQMRYMLPRLGGKGLVLSRLGGGIGTRGPGETKLEVDRRRIRRKIHDIEQEIKDVCSQRALHRSQRITSGLACVTLVGYTNAGKSTLLNHLTDAGVLVEDKLFATLDPTIRLLVLPSGRKLLLSDTVGFIRKLPHSLIAAFRATLEEVVYADVLMHVVDASAPDWEKQSEAVHEVLRELAAADKPTITVMNKVDRIGEDIVLKRLLREPDTVGISAKYGTGVEKLLEMLEDVLSRLNREVLLLIPYGNAGLANLLHEQAIVLEQLYEPEGIKVRALLTPAVAGQLAEYILGEEAKA